MITTCIFDKVVSYVQLAQLSRGLEFSNLSQIDNLSNTTTYLFLSIDNP
jgi:hypothetical protein